jgi:hypothetical protein
MGSGQFSLKKLSEYYLRTYYSRLEYSEMIFGPFEKSHFSPDPLPMLGMGALVDAKVLCDGFFCESWGHSSSIDQNQTFMVSYIYKNNNANNKPISYGKNALLMTLVVYVYHLWLAKEPSSSNWQKPLSKQNVLPVCDVYQCIVGSDIA